MVPTNEPTPENGDTTPNLMVSLAPDRLLAFELPLEQAASTGAAAVPTPATIPHRSTWRRETSGVTSRGYVRQAGSKRTGNDFGERNINPWTCGSSASGSR